MPLWLLVWLGLLGLNLASFLCFGLDKQRARTGAWRIREADLLLLAAAGGTGGAYLGRWHFRHKTRKAGFSMALHLIAIGQIAFVLWLLARP